MSEDSGATLDTELKRYSIKPDSWDAFLAVWRRMVALRKRCGFEIPFAYVDKKANVFTWAVSHSGDFEAASRAFHAAPERPELDVAKEYVTAVEIAKVSRLVVP